MTNSVYLDDKSYLDDVVIFVRTLDPQRDHSTLIVVENQVEYDYLFDKINNKSTWIWLGDMPKEASYDIASTVVKKQIGPRNIDIRVLGQALPNKQIYTLISVNCFSVSVHQIVEPVIHWKFKTYKAELAWAHKTSTLYSASAPYPLATPLTINPLETYKFNLDANDFKMPFFTQQQPAKAKGDPEEQQKLCL